MCTKVVYVSMKDNGPIKLWALLGGRKNLGKSCLVETAMSYRGWRSGTDGTKCGTIVMQTLCINIGLRWMLRDLYSLYVAFAQKSTLRVSSWRKNTVSLGARLMVCDKNFSFMGVYDCCGKIVCVCDILGDVLECKNMMICFVVSLMQYKLVQERHF